MCSSRSLALLVLAGCNQLLGIKDTDPAPPFHYDGGIDAARGCPAIGAQPDSYSPFVHQVYVQDCDNVSSVPAGRAVGRCHDPVGSVHEGTWGQPLPPAVGVTTPNGFVTARLTPDAQQMLVPATVSGMPTTYTIDMWTRQGDGTWQQVAVTGFPADFGKPVLLSTIGHASTGDRVLVTTDVMSEWELAGGTWQLVQTHTELPPTTVMSMTSDALRMLAVSTGSVVYTDRPDATAPFRTPVPLMGVPTIEDLFMTDDCARIYMSGFGALYYVQQD